MKITALRGLESERGFTLPEIIVTLSIAAILTGLTVPNFTEFIQRVRLSIVAYDLHSAINLARSEAIKRNGQIELTSINGNWKNGWLITSTDGQTIMSHEALPSDFKVMARFSGGAHQISFNGTGHSRAGAGSQVAQFGHIFLSLGNNSRLIVLNFLGRVRLCDPTTDKNCRVNSGE